MRVCRQQSGQHAGVHEFRTHNFEPMQVSLVDEQLTVQHGNHLYVQHVPIPGWREMAHAAPWHVAFEARTTIAVDNHWLRNVEVTQGALVGNAHVLVSLEGEGCPPRTDTFVYYATPSISRVSLTNGPVDGGTPVRVFGKRLTGGSTQVACRFGRKSVPGTRRTADAIDCVTPAMDAVGMVAVDVSLNGIDFTSSAPQPPWFTFSNPLLTAVQPNTTTRVEAPLNLVLFGDSLDGGTNYTCRFEVPDISPTTHPATFSARSGAIMCNAPGLSVINRDVSLLRVEVSLNGVDFTASNLSVRYYTLPEKMEISPTSGPAEGSTRIVLQGHFADVDTWVSKFCRARIIWKM